MKEHLKLYDEKMTKTLKSLDKEFGTIRAGRANPAVLDKIQVDYYGVPTAINAMAQVKCACAREICAEAHVKYSQASVKFALRAS